MKLRIYQYEKRKNYKNYYNTQRQRQYYMPMRATFYAEVTYAKNSNYIVNLAGSEGFAMNNEIELYSAVVTSTLSPMYYEGESRRVERIASLVKVCDPLFVAQLAVYTRTKMYLRSVPLLLAVELAKVHSGDDLVSRMVRQIVLRADEIMELLACYRWRNPFLGNGQSRYGMGSLSRQILSGLKKAFNSFDEYQFAKYNNTSRAIKLRDALFLVHPKAEIQEQQAIFDHIAKDSLPTPYTWETELSVLGQKEFASEVDKNKAFAQKWGELILSGRLGFMAMLRNLRNILSLKDMSQEAMENLINNIADRMAVLTSKQLPFRFLSAYKEIKEMDSQWTPKVIEALEQAIKHAAYNIAGFTNKTRVVIASDMSGSMMSQVSANSSVMLYEIGLMLSMLLRYRCKNASNYLFATLSKEVALPTQNILENIQTLYTSSENLGCCTNGHLVIEDLIKKRKVADKVMFFTDCQLWNSGWGSLGSLSMAWNYYKEVVAPKAKLYIFDLAGYGQAPINLVQEDVYLLAGWSDKVFDILAALENGSSAIEEIKKIKL